MKRRDRAVRPLRGTASLPGDKSISHRALMAATLAPGRSRIANLNVAADVVATAEVLTAVGGGVRIDRDNAQAEVDGCGWDGLREPEPVLDAGNSGTTLRAMLGICSAIPGLSVLTGDSSLRRRPMLRAVVPLRQMGASIDGRAHGDRAPLTVRGGPLHAVDVDLSVASAQVKTAVLLAGLRAEGTTVVTEPAPSRDHTERMLGALGATLERDGLSVSVRGGGGEIRPMDMAVPGDVSSAAFLIVAALLCPGSEIELTGVGLNPTRTGLLETLVDMGGSITWEATDGDYTEPVGSVRVERSRLTGVDVDVSPSLMDEVPILCVAATQAEGRTRIRGGGELRVKESDRIAAMSDGLTKLGADVEPRPDGLVITGPTPLRGGDVDPRGDHRIALAFAIAGLISQDNVVVHGWSCVDTSFPEFLDVLGRLQDKR
jgi:3-phosphoshikimate 1-carboxyvinyltransferase